MTLFYEFLDRFQVLKLILYYNVVCIGDCRNVMPFFSKCRNVFLYGLISEGSSKECSNMCRIRDMFWRHE